MHEGMESRESTLHLQNWKKFNMAQLQSWDFHCNSPYFFKHAHWYITQCFSWPLFYFFNSTLSFDCCLPCYNIHFSRWSPLFAICPMFLQLFDLHLCSWLCFHMLVWMIPSCLVAAPKLFSLAFLRTQVSYPQIAIFKGQLIQNNKLSSLGFAKWSQVFDPLWLPHGMKWILWSELGHT